MQIGERCALGHFTVIGYPLPGHLDRTDSEQPITHIGDNCIIGSHAIIYEGAIINDNSTIEDYCRIGEYVSIGKNCMVLYAAQIFGDTKIGNSSIVAGFCCERAEIGNNARIFGSLLHSHREPHLGWDDVTEKSPAIEDNVFIGFAAKIIGGIKIGSNSYVVSGATVTKDVPAKSIVYGVNKIVSYKNWKGELRNSLFFEAD